MRKKFLKAAGIPAVALDLAMEAAIALGKQRVPHDEILAQAKELVSKPRGYVTTLLWGPTARKVSETQLARAAFQPRQDAAPWKQWGKDLEEGAVEQMVNATELPVAVQGALMPDAHLGYGLPIGGVLATDNAVIPYAVGVDISCMVKMTVLDLPLQTSRDLLKDVLCHETRFGMGSHFQTEYKRQHSVLDADWAVSPVTKDNKDKAWSQLGSSGGGNHFVEFGQLSVGEGQEQKLGLAAGVYLTLLSHSGSRGVGSEVCSYYSKIAQDQHPELPHHLRDLSWLSLDSEAGQEYWAAMSLMGEYASANHECIHRHISKSLGAEVLLDVENYHNFAWKEKHFGKDLIVHRKGATPAGVGVLGIIPGTMADPTFLVEGKGKASSMNSAAHGAGRQMSRTRAKKVLSKEEWLADLKAKGIELLSAGLDEAPGAYKDINKVMSEQQDLVTPLASFQPTVVRMAKSEKRR